SPNSPARARQLGNSAERREGFLHPTQALLQLRERGRVRDSDVLRIAEVGPADERYISLLQDVAREIVAAAKLPLGTKPAPHVREHVERSLWLRTTNTAHGVEPADDEIATALEFTHHLRNGLLRATERLGRRRLGDGTRIRGHLPLKLRHGG